MKLFSNVNETHKEKGGFHMMQDRKLPTRHIPPHERKAMVHIEFDEEDWVILNEVFGDEDTASAALDIISEAPPEIQILAVQLINIIKEVA